MKLTIRSLLPSRNYDALIAAIAGFLIIHAFTRHSGIGISPDSVVYMSTAANIHDHGVINDFSGSPMMDFPAFYPIFLSTLLFLTGHDAMGLGPTLNSLLFALLIFVCGWLMERFSFRSKWYKWTLLSFIVLSPCLLEVYSMIWSETLFLLLLVVFILYTRRYFLSHRARTLIEIGIIAGLASVTRYAGITLIGTGGLLILCDSSLKKNKKLLHFVLFGCVACAFPAVNLIRNRLVTGTLTGFREPAIRSFGRNLHDFGSVFCDWMPFFNNHYALASLLGAFWIIFFTGAFLTRLVRRERFFSYENIATAYFIVYTVFILLTATISRFQQLDSRLLSPLFIPWIWGATCWIPTRIAAWAPYRRRWAIIASIVAALCFQAGQLLAFNDNWEGIKYAGIPGYTEDQWTHSQTIDFVRRHRRMLQSGGTLYSNAYEGVWFLTGLQADMIPHKDLHQDIREFLAEDKFYVIWFNDGLNPDLLSMDFIGHYKKLTDKYTFDDGAVYFFTSDSTRAKY